MQDGMAASIMEEYERQYPVYAAFTEKVSALVAELLRENGIPVHSVTSRVKGKARLIEKLLGSKGKYLKLSDITDVCGIRIITYYADDVDGVATVIENEFDVDEVNSVDKRALLDPDRFGYLSLHYVTELPADRLDLTEYRRFKGCKVEIQIRSILQHTWAEIEHDLGYKSERAVPKEIRRRFSRLAGLLELADSEFSAIRDILTEYMEALPQQIQEAPASVYIDQASLHAFVTNSTRVIELDNAIAAMEKAEVADDRDFLELIVGPLYSLGLDTIAELDSLLEAHADELLRFAAEVESTRVEPAPSCPAGASIWYLLYVLIARKGDLQEVRDYVELHDIAQPGEHAEAVAEDIIKTYKRAIGGPR